MQDLTDLEIWLRHCIVGKTGQGHPNLTRFVREFRDDLAWLNIDDFEIHEPKQGAPYFHYTLGEVRNSVDNADPSSSKDELFHVRNFDAPGLAYGELHWLFLIAQEARQTIPKLWQNDEELRKNIADRSRKKHFNTLNEIFWIARWNAINTDFVRSECKLAPGLGGSVDWQAPVKVLNSDSFNLNIEVKNLVSSMRYLVGADIDISKFVTEGKRGLDSKFPGVATRDLNIVCMTVYMRSEDLIASLADDILANYPGIDAVLIWAAHVPPPINFLRMSRMISAFDKQKGGLINTMFKPPSKQHQFPPPGWVPAWNILPWQQDAT